MHSRADRVELGTADELHPEVLTDFLLKFSGTRRGAMRGIFSQLKVSGMGTGAPRVSILQEEKAKPRAARPGNRQFLSDSCILVISLTEK